MGGIILGVVFIVWCAYQFPTAGLAIVIILILMGLCIPGAVQSLALRLIFTGTRWWFIGTVVGISTGIVFFYLYLPIDRSYGFIPIFLFFFSYSAFTGFALMKMKPKAL